MSESATASILAWTVPQVEGPVVGQRRIADLNLLEREAWDQGFAAGRTAGRAAALTEQETLTQELRARVQRLQGVLNLQARPLHARA